ncbi:MAG TPA: PilZ domain-containing protein [Candidatus Eisenbacteria bacterium]|jgi:c-di-GMP-binding flagellar brake protein YcgR|nr:PilZ domain-containing protein [Candidatus Eisenbacteria bacterium]
MAEFVWNSRKLFRVLFETQANFRLHRASKKTIRLKEKTVAAKLLDLSAGGCGLESPSFLPAGVKLNIFLKRDLLGKEGRGKHSKITGVIRTSRQLPNRKYRLGVQFEKISSVDLRLIRTLVEEQERRDEKRITFGQP